MRSQMPQLHVLLFAVVLLMPGCVVDPASVATDDRLDGASGSPSNQPSLALPRSLPADPFEIESAPIRATFLLMPPHRDGMVPLDGADIGLHGTLTGQLYAAAIPGLSVPSTGRVIDAFASMRPRVAYQESYALTNLMRERNAEYFGATHVIDVELSGGESQPMELRLNMMIPNGGVQQVTLTSGQGEEFFLAAEAAGWILSNAGLDLSEEELARAKVPVWGPDIGGWEDELRVRLAGDPQAPEWDALMNLDPLPPLLILMRGHAAIVTGDPRMVQSHLPEPVPGQAHPYVHVARSAMAEWLGDIETARHERLLAAARFPGLHGFIIDWAWSLHGTEQRDEAFAETMRRWYERTSKSPYEANLMGNALVDVAWKYRGTDFIGDVPAENRELYTQYNTESIAVFEEAATRTGSIPWLSHSRIKAWGSFGRQDLIAEIFDRNWVDFPDNPEVLHATLHFLRPRWGGEHDIALKLIEKVLEERPENPFVFDYWLGYVQPESEFMREEREIPEREIREWIESRPGWREALELSAKRRLLAADDVDAAGDAFVAYSILQDVEALSAIVDRHPNLYRKYVWDHQYAAFSLARFAYEFAARGEWEKILDVVATIRSESEAGRETGLRPEFMMMMEMYARLHLGERDGLEQDIAYLEQSGGIWRAAALYARLHLEDDPDRVLAELEVDEEHSLKVPVRALAHARKGLTAEESQDIRATLASVGDKDSLIPRFMVNELKRILDGEAE